jgi:HK97 gp10 family phage protein
MSINGGDKIAAQLKEMERAMRNESLRTALMEGAKIVLPEARRRAPRRSGRLAGSIQVKENRAASVSVFSSEIYGPVIEFGWPRRNIPPRPFMRPALYENYEQVHRAIERKLQELMGLK